MHDPYRGWAAGALCRDAGTDMFFPEGGSYLSKKRGSQAIIKPEALAAKALCVRCPVLEKCRVETLGEVHGIWGGLDERERLLLRRRRLHAVQRASKAERLVLGRKIARWRRLEMDWREVARRLALTKTLCQELHELGRQ